MKTETLFPPCRIDDCPERTHHKHILDWQRDFLASQEKYVAVVGGKGAGKTLPADILCVLLMLAVPGNRGFIGRRTYDKLHDPTLRLFMETLERGKIPHQALEHFKGYPHRVILANGSEVVFRQTSDVGRYLGPEYGFIYLDEASEEPESTFKGLMERLRLPHAENHLKFILTTNPPHQSHWIAQKFPRPGVQQIGESSYRMIRVSARVNQHLPQSYIADLMANNPASEIRRIIDGEYGFEMQGKPVYCPPFRYEKHVGEPKLHLAPLLRGWDFGFRHPVVTWHQIWTCRARGTHWSILDEFDGQQIEAEPFAFRVIERTGKMFAGARSQWVMDAGDASGAAVSDKGPGPIIRLAKPPWNLKFRYTKLRDIDPGLGLIRERLRKACPCGESLVQVHRRCQHVIDALAGGYHYAEARSPMPKNEKPVKDSWYDDYADSVRYVAWNFLRQEMLDPGLLDALTDKPAEVDQFVDNWAWMEQVR